MLDFRYPSSKLVTCCAPLLNSSPPTVGRNSVLPDPAGKPDNNLVGGFNPFEKYEFVNGNNYPIYEMEK